MGRKSLYPNFLILGAQKSGTSSLNYYLQEHPDIYMHPKELHFFDDRDDTFHFGAEYYKGFFAGVEEEQMVGECTPCYLFAADAPHRIHEILPKIRLITILRNPIDRAYSHYWKNIKNGREKKCFEEAIKLENERLEIDKWHYLNFSYISRGLYVEQIERYFQFFNRDQMLFIFYDELAKQPEKVLFKIFQFLKVETSFQSSRLTARMNPATKTRSKLLFQLAREDIPLPRPLNSSLFLNFIKKINARFNMKKFKYPPMAAQTRQYLRNFFKPYNDRLAGSLELDLSQWT